MKKKIKEKKKMSMIKSAIVVVCFAAKGKKPTLIDEKKPFTNGKRSVREKIFQDFTGNRFRSQMLNRVTFDWNMFIGSMFIYLLVDWLPSYRLHWNSHEHMWNTVTHRGWDRNGIGEYKKNGYYCDARAIFKLINNNFSVLLFTVKLIYGKMIQRAHTYLHLFILTHTFASVVYRLLQWHHQQKQRQKTTNLMNIISRPNVQTFSNTYVQILHDTSICHVVINAIKYYYYNVGLFFHFVFYPRMFFINFSFLSSTAFLFCLFCSAINWIVCMCVCVWLCDGLKCGRIISDRWHKTAWKWIRLGI